MSAMEDLDWIFVEQVRELQSRFPAAHDALLNWGRWSRSPQVLPRVSRPALWDMAKPGDPGDWAPDVVAAFPEDAEVKAERAEEDPTDEKLGRELDELIHTTAIGLVWRQVLRAAYVTREIPEWQMPRTAGLRFSRCSGSAEDQFIAHLGGALAYIEWERL